MISSSVSSRGSVQWDCFLRRICISRHSCRLRAPVREGRNLVRFSGFLQFLFRSVDTGVDGQFVTDAFEGFAEQAVVVQRTDQVFRQFALMFGQVAFAELFSQDFVE